MSWALNFNGINNHVLIDCAELGGSWSVRFKIKDNGSQSGTHYRIANEGVGNTGTTLDVAKDGSGVRFSRSGSPYNFTGLSFNPEDEIELIYTSGGSNNFELLVGGVSQGTLTVNKWCEFGVLGYAWSTSGGYQLEYFEFTASNPENSRMYDATASNHNNTGLQPVLVDTINSNNAIGVNMPTDGSAWIDLGGGGTDQAITVAASKQLTESQLIDVSEFNIINAIIVEQVTQSQLSNLILDNQISTVVAEQKTECSLVAIATISSLIAVIAEQLTQSTIIANTENQVIYAVQAQQLTEAIAVNVTTDGAQGVNVVVTEQTTQAQAVSATELQLLQAVIAEQLTQVINADIEQSLDLIAITAEQLSEAVTVTVDESSGIFVSVVQTEQLTQAIAANIDVEAIANAVISEQLTQYSTQQISVDLTVSAVIAEQLTQAELVAIIQGEIATSLNIDIDQITLEILTPTYSIESLTPIYTIKHLH